MRLLKPTSAAQVQRMLTAAKPGDCIENLTTSFPAKDLLLNAKFGVTVRLRLHDVGSVHSTLLLKDCAGCTIECEVIDPRGYAAIFSISGRGNRYINNRITGGVTVDDRVPRGLWIGNAGVPEVGAVCKDSLLTGVPATGIVYMGTDGKINDNTVQDGGATGIVIAAHGGQVGGETVITGNILRGLKGHGIQSDVIRDNNPTERVNASLNQISECASGVYLIYATYWNLTGNQIWNCRDDGVQIGMAWKGDKHDCGHITLTGNHINRNPSGVRIMGEGLTHDVLITGNDLSDNTEHGVFCDPGEMRRLLCTHNILSGCAKHLDLKQPKLVDCLVDGNLH
jgi:hypothetical protein